MNGLLAEPLDRGWRERAFPWLSPERVLFHDDAIIVVDKPSGISCQPVRDDDEFDLASRIRYALGDPNAYLGTHQRLDRDTSGVILYATSSRANSSLSRQFELREVDKRYIALVDSWDGPEEVVLRDRLIADEEGRSRVGSDGVLAITRVRVTERRGRRAQLDIKIDTGRTHQIRAQLAHRGSPIVGDAWYGGVPASRLMLHASELRLRHPVEGHELVFRAPLPACFDDWFAGRKTNSFVALLEELRARRLELGRAGILPSEASTSAFRLAHEGVIPGVTIDLYANWFLVQFYDDELDRGPLIDALAALQPSGIYQKIRPRQANELGDEVAELAPSTPVWGEPAPFEFAIRERGIPYAVRLGDGLSTGIFLDQRENRSRVRELAAGKRVLNLFAYTCAFSVAAGVGGAVATLSVDASGASLDRGRQNLERCGLDAAHHRTVRADVFEWIERALKRSERFDLIVCDPPTYSAVKRKRGPVSRWTSGASWTGLAERCAELLVPGGTYLATSNDRRMTQPQFRRYIRQASGFAAVRDLQPPVDFRSAFGSTLHGVLARKHD